MDRMNLREAAERTRRSVTTLRRYIRAGRLHAVKDHGRYGPEYFVDAEELRRAGFTVDAPDEPGEQLRTMPVPSVPSLRPQETVPLSLYLELQMKHEQLLVQYGMVRASGMRVMELQEEVETGRRQIAEQKEEISRLKDRLASEIAASRKRVREAELELEGRGLEISALREKVRGLEMLTRNAVTNESIDRQFAALREQARRVSRRASPRSDDPKRDPRPGATRAGEH